MLITKNAKHFLQQLCIISTLNDKFIILLKPICITDLKHSSPPSVHLHC